MNKNEDLLGKEIPDSDTLIKQYPDFHPTAAVQYAVEFLAKVVSGEMGARNGRTALYWHLMSVVQKHAEFQDGK